MAVPSLIVVDEGTIGRYSENAYLKLAARNRADATTYAICHNLT